jgi:hypothetical protein
MPRFGKSGKGDITSMEGGEGRARSCCTRPTAASPSISMVMSARSKSRKSKSLGEEQHNEDGISNVAMTHARSQSPPSNPTFPSQPAPTPHNLHLHPKTHLKSSSQLIEHLGRARNRLLVPGANSLRVLAPLRFKIGLLLSWQIAHQLGAIEEVEESFCGRYAGEWFPRKCRV